MVTYNFNDKMGNICTLFKYWCVLSELIIVERHTDYIGVTLVNYGLADCFIKQL